MFVVSVNDLFQFCAISALINNYSSGPNGLLTQRPWGERNNCFSEIQVVGQKYRHKNMYNLSQQNAIQPPLLWFSKPVLFATSGL